MSRPTTTTLHMVKSDPHSPDYCGDGWPADLDAALDTIDAAITTLQAGGSGPSFADNEAPSGLVNSSNTAYTLAHTPNPAASLMLFKNGVLQKPSGADYTLTAAAISFVAAPQTGDTLEAFYRY